MLRHHNILHILMSYLRVAEILQWDRLHNDMEGMMFYEYIVDLPVHLVAVVVALQAPLQVAVEVVAVEVVAAVVQVELFYMFSIQEIEI